MIVGCYTMHLYCRYHPTSGGPREEWRHEPDEKATGFADITSQSAAACKFIARGRGWKFGTDGDVTCPACAKPHTKENTK